jgi:predicted transglutaminase-like cysteine proteinase
LLHYLQNGDAVLDNIAQWVVHEAEDKLPVEQRARFLNAQQWARVVGAFEGHVAAAAAWSL